MDKEVSADAVDDPGEDKEEDGGETGTAGSMNAFITESVFLLFCIADMQFSITKRANSNRNCDRKSIML